MAEAEARMRPPRDSLRKKRSTFALERNGPCSHHLSNDRPKSTNSPLDLARLRLQKAHGRIAAAFHWALSGSFGSSRAHNAGRGLESQSQEAGVVSCDTILAALSTCSHHV